MFLVFRMFIDKDMETEFYGPLLGQPRRFGILTMKPERNFGVYSVTGTHHHHFLHILFCFVNYTVRISILLRR
jgi:hypothetical protein